MKKECTMCGMCRSDCPVFKVLLKESVSPRGKAKLASEEVYDVVFYACTLCKACTKSCPLELDLKIENLRAKLVELGLETDANKKMIKNIRRYGNPFGKVEEGKIPKDLYCC